MSLPLPPLPLALYDFHLRVQEPMRLPSYKGGVLRGGFGITFKRIVCLYPPLPPCRACALLYRCPYPAIFETPPPPGSEVLRTHEAIPQSFVLWPPDDRRTHFAPGQHLRFRVTLIGHGIAALPYFIVTFQRLGKLGLGPDRARYRLLRVDEIDPRDERWRPVWREDGGASADIGQAPDAVTLLAAFADQEASSLSLDFLTPTRLKFDGHIVAAAPPFHVVVRTLLRRLSSLSYFHAGLRWEIDYRGWIERAQAVEMAGAEMHWVDWERYSTRQQQSMDFGGIVGKVSYVGEGLGEFAPLLRLGQWVHVGKGTVFGQGRYRLTVGQGSDGVSDGAM